MSLYYVLIYSRKGKKNIIGYLNQIVAELVFVNSITSHSKIIIFITFHSRWLRKLKETTAAYLIANISSLKLFPKYYYASFNAEIKCIPHKSLVS